MKTEKELFDYLKGKEKIYIYGAGKNARRLTERIKQHGYNPEAYIVTKLEGNPLEIDGKKVWKADILAASEVPLSAITVLIAVAGKNVELIDDLLDLGFYNIISFDLEFFGKIKRSQYADEYNQLQDRYFLAFNYPDMEYGHGALIEKETKCALFRFSYYGWSDNIALNRYCNQENFEYMFGTYLKLPFSKKGDMNKDFVQKMGIEIYVIISHLDKNKGIIIKEEGLIPLQVGAALTSIRMGYQTDNTGENISVKNRDYCECTGLYWIWKNTKGQKYVGLSHYRRRFKLDEEGFCYILEQKIDVVAILPQFTHSSMKDFFSVLVYSHDWQYMKEALREYDKAYEKTIEIYENSHFFIPCNMAIFRRDWFDRYCEFAFFIATEIERKYNERGIIRQDRYIGYLFENLLSLFLMHNHKKMKIVYTDMVFIR